MSNTDDDAEAFFRGTSREGDIVREVLVKAGTFFRESGPQKALSTYRRRVNDLRSEIDLAIIECDRRKQAEKGQDG